jgi:hypothetical protein
METLNQYPQEIVEQMRLRYQNEFCYMCNILSICDKKDLNDCIVRSIEVKEFEA